jgi:hypothetical protein
MASTTRAIELLRLVMTYDELRDRLQHIDDKECGEGASPAEITEGETRLSLTFPGDYRRFLQDFGWLAVGSKEIAGLGTDAPAWLNVVATYRTEHHESHAKMPANLLPIMNDGGGDLYCLDCDDPEGRVSVWGHTTGLDALGVSFVDWLVAEIENDDGGPV